MPSMKTVKRRMSSVATTKKIMRAMGMVATSKLQKDKPRLEAARSFYREAERMIKGIHGIECVAENAFIQKRAVRNTAYIVITGNRGLCGSYNANISEKVLTHMNAGKKEKIITIGSKGYEYLKRHGKNIIQRHDDVLETAFCEDALKIAYTLVSLYHSGEIDEAYVAYTQFESMLSHSPKIVKILPVDSNVTPKASAMHYEPDIEFYLDRAILLHIGAFFYAALNESIACEQSARMVSMDSATNNATEIIEKLTRVYNRRRQTTITQEINEVVSSADMLK